MITCPECHAEVQPDWDWCHACGFDPDGALPVAAPAGRELPPGPPPPPRAGSVHPEVLRSELVPLDGGDHAEGAGGSGSRARARTRPGTGGYVPRPSRQTPLLIAAGVGAVVVVVAVALLVSRPAPIQTTTVDRSAATITPTTALAVSTWLLPEGGFAVDLPVVPTPTTSPEVPVPFVSATAYAGTADGRTYLVASHLVHPDYRWEDIGRAFIDATDGLAAQHGFAVVSRSAGAIDEMSSSRFKVIEGRRADETQADFDARLDGPATGEGVGLISGNHLYVVLVRSDSVPHAQFTQILDSIVVS